MQLFEDKDTLWVSGLFSVEVLIVQTRLKRIAVLFMEQLSKSKQSNLLAILFCQRKAILISGFFALIKILTLSTGPMFLYAFIRIAEGGETFKYETYALTAGLFLAKCLESLSERQWYFQTRLIGLQVRSLLSAAIYQKQLRLSNAAKTTHSPGEIMNYVTVDAYKIGEFPYWFHQIWTTGLQICLALIIIYLSVGLATIAALIVIILTVLGNYPVAKLQHNYLTKIMMAQDGRLKGITEALANMKVLKMYAWETHFKNVIERLRKGEADCLSAVQSQKGYYIVLFWSSPIIVSVATFWACYMLGIPLNTSNVFTFLATLRIVQEPIRLIPDVAGVFIEANVSFTRIVKFLEAPELQNRHINKNSHGEEREQSVVIDSTRISWDADSLKPTLTNINLIIKCGEKVAICGGVGSGKSTLLATILREVPYTDGIVQVYGKIAYVSQTSWIQTGTIQQNIIFGSAMDECRYQQDLEMLPFGDGTVIGERGVNLSGGQKQRVQLARALYQDADIYLLDDPFSAVDAHTATGLFNSFKTLSMHTMTAAFSEKHGINGSQQRSKTPKEEIQKTYTQEQLGEPVGDQLIKQEEREIGNTGLKPYRQYLNQSKGFLYLTLAIISHLMYLVGQLVQNLWLATELDDFNLSRSETPRDILGDWVSGHRKAIFSKLMTSLFRAPMSFYDSTPLGRILSRVSSDMSIVDLELCMRLSMTLASTMTTYFSYGILVFLTWPMLFVIIPTVYCNHTVTAHVLQSYYFASSKELMRIDGTTKSSVASHIAESIAGATTIRAFGEEDRFFAEFLHLIDTNASPFFHSFSANEWLIQRLEIICAIVLSCSALAMTLFHLGASDSGYIGMALSYGLSLNIYLVSAVQCQCILANLIISVERLEQYMHIPSEAPEIIEATVLHSTGHLLVQYRPNAPLVLQGISCIFEGGHKIGIVGRTGSGKTTLISALFRLVEPTEGMIVIDDLNISNIGLHDLRSRFAVIPQDPTLFSGSVRYNLDPLSEHTDHEIWEVLAKCRLRELVEKKEEGLNSLGKLVEYDQPMKLMNKEGSLFGQLVKEYWAHSNNNANGCSEDC
ncbi:hypothetical protein HYC85_013160 [Camellia sinensis]|uniref:ABC-type xenobiotic transporter n=1 Tax=Camellia sinensis TaxID=4442 RepID=A0A7J7H2L9_CAMSI|nr:hypothetical protein HYC85_013160 [Camellia sinensis]